MCVCVCGLSKDVEYSDRGGGCVVTLQRFACILFLFCFSGKSELFRKEGWLLFIGLCCCNKRANMEELGCDPEGKCMKCFTVPPDIQVNDT